MLDKVGATAAAPLAWLRLELMTRSDPDLRLTQWPDGTEMLLARSYERARGKKAPTKGIFGVLSKRSTAAKTSNRSIQS